MKKKIKKIFNIVLMILAILTLNSALLINCVQAVDMQETHLYNKGQLDKIIKYNGKLVTTTHVVYRENEKEFPAYCLNPNLPGVGENGEYDVTNSEKITDVGLWRVITNGYPYKTIEELEVCDEQEAYIATKQAVYCYILHRGTENYEAVGEAGKRTINALNKILENAQNSTAIPLNNAVEITTNQTKWETDELNKNYVSKTYEVSAITSITDYTVSVENIRLPEGMLITDTENKEKTEFKSNEKFKILIPIYELNTVSTFKIKVNTHMDTKPVIYGKAPGEKAQDYALTTYSYEDATGEIYDTYGKNETQIKIIKKDKNESKFLKGVEFEILNENKEVVYSNLVTDENGEIILKGIMPGKYYIKEVKTLDGYIPYEEFIEVNIKLNEKIDVTVNNYKEHKKEVEENKTEIEVDQNIKKLPVTGM